MDPQKENEPLKESELKGPLVRKIKLSKGETAYRLYEPSKEDKDKDKDESEEKQEILPIVVCLHGFSNFSYCFEQFATELVHSGLRVLTFDFYGRGRTSWPGRRIACDAELLVEQTRELVQALHIETFTLVGLSMGGAVAVRFAEEYPDMVTSLILLAPAGLPITQPFVAKVVECCCLGDFVMCCVGKKSLANGQKNDFYNPKAHKEWVELQTSMVRWQQRRTPGYMKAIHSTLRHFPLGSLLHSFQKVGKHRRRGLIVWGNKDIVCPYKPNASIIEDLMPHLRLVTMADCGHMVLYEKFHAVTKIVLAFLSVPGGRKGRNTYPLIPSSSLPLPNSDNKNTNSDNQPLAVSSGSFTPIPTRIPSPEVTLELSPAPSIISETPSPPETLFLMSHRETNEITPPPHPVGSSDGVGGAIHERGDSLG